MAANPETISDQKGSLHPVAWMIWCSTAALITLAARSPWITLGMGLIVLAVLRKLEPAPFRVRRFVWLLPVVLIPTALNLLFSRAGTTILLDLQLGWVGGPYTFEALLFGLMAGIQLAVTLLVFQVFSLTITPQDLLRRTPPSFYPLGVMASIAVTFTASVRRRFDELREAQQLRGRQVQGWRALPFVLTPLLVVSLEDAMATAEGLAAMGWAAEESAGFRHGFVRDPRRLFTVVGWVLLGCAILLLVVPTEGRLAALGLAGVGLLLLGFSNRGRRKQPYRPERWRWRDGLMVASSLSAVALTLYVIGFRSSLIIYQPYPTAMLPPWTGSQGVLLILMTAPLWVRTRD